jgi:DNA-3-methyladenine glycosylase II
MFTLQREDIFPIDDLGIQQGMQKLYGLDKSSKTFKKDMENIANSWKPYRSIASRYLWRWKDSK